MSLYNIIEFTECFSVFICHLDVNLCGFRKWKQGVQLSVPCHGFTCSGDAKSRHPDSNPKQSFHRCHDGSQLRSSVSTDPQPQTSLVLFGQLSTVSFSQTVREGAVCVWRGGGGVAGGPFRVLLRLTCWFFPHVCPHMGGLSEVLPPYQGMRRHHKYPQADRFFWAKVSHLKGFLTIFSLWDGTGELKMFWQASGGSPCCYDN